MAPIGHNSFSENNVGRDFVDLNTVLNGMQDAGNYTNFVFLDSCRVHPYGEKFKTRGFGRIEAPRGTVIAFGADEHQYGIEHGSAGIFTEALLKEIKTPDIDAIDMLRRVRIAVNNRTGGSQNPIVMERSLVKFYFVPNKTKTNRNSQDLIKWNTYATGMARSRSEKKKAFIYFRAGWCSHSSTMELKTFTDAAVIAAINRDFIPIWVDDEKNPEIGKKYKISGVPYSWFLTDSGNPIGKRPGLCTPEVFLKVIDQVLSLTE